MEFKAVFSLLMQILYLVGGLLMTFDLLTCVHLQGIVCTRVLSLPQCAQEKECRLVFIQF